MSINEVRYLPECGSTNAYMKEHFEEFGPVGAVYTTNQTAGRGRLGRSWLDAPHKGLYYTAVIRTDLVQPATLPLFASLAVCDALRERYRIDCQIKWPNDLVLNKKKICGILTEMSAQLDYINHVVIGIGINVQNESFPKEIEQVATSILMETGQHVNRAELIEAVLEQFERYYEIFLETEDLSGLVKEYNAHLINMQKQVRVLDPKEPYEAKAMGITPHGELIVDTWEGRKLVSSGEVSVRGVYGYV